MLALATIELYGIFLRFPFENWSEPRSGRRRYDFCGHVRWLTRGCVDAVCPRICPESGKNCVLFCHSKFQVVWLIIRSVIKAGRPIDKRGRPWMTKNVSRRPNRWKEGEKNKNAICHTTLLTKWNTNFAAIIAVIWYDVHRICVNCKSLADTKHCESE